MEGGRDEYKWRMEKGKNMDGECIRGGIWKEGVEVMDVVWRRLLMV